MVGGSYCKAGVWVGLGGEVVAAELLPAGGCVPPGNKLVAGGFGDVCPAQVDGAGCGLGVQDGRGEVGVRGGGDGSDQAPCWPSALTARMR